MHSSIPKNKTTAAWLALIFGQLGLHRIYLFGMKDLWAWVHPLIAAIGWWGVHRVQLYGQDDQVAWLLIPLLGFTLAATSITAIYYGLMLLKNGMPHTTRLHRALRPATPTGSP